MSIPHDPVKRVESMAAHLAKLADRARAQGRRNVAENYLLRAWAAYDWSEHEAAGRCTRVKRKVEKR